MKLPMQTTREMTCDICDTEFDLEESVEVNSTSTCPCCTMQDRLTHGLDISTFRHRR